MTAPAQINLSAQKRVPFDETIPDYRADWSSATPLMEIRPAPGSQGDALVQLGESVSGGEGVKLTWDAEREFTHQGVTYTGATLVQIIVNETTLEGLDYAPTDPSKQVILYYDLHLTPSGGKKFVAISGQFIINPGVTL